MKKIIHLGIYAMTHDVLSITYVSLEISFFSVLFSAFLGLPLGLWLCGNSKYRTVVGTVCNALQALPTVLIGLSVYMILSRKGILGFLGLMYSTKAIIIGQCILITPLVAILTQAALERLDKRYKRTALTLGANKWEMYKVLFIEARFALTAVLVTAFGRVIGEIGISMMLGGNIAGYTRTMTTTMSLEYDKGAFDLAINLGLVLLGISLIVNVLLKLLQGKSQEVDIV